MDCAPRTYWLEMVKFPVENYNHLKRNSTDFKLTKATGSSASECSRSRSFNKKFPIF